MRWPVCLHLAVTVLSAGVFTCTNRPAAVHGGPEHACVYLCAESVGALQVCVHKWEQWECGVRECTLPHVCHVCVRRE